MLKKQSLVQNLAQFLFHVYLKKLGVPYIHFLIPLFRTHCASMHIDISIALRLAFCHVFLYTTRKLKEQLIVATYVPSDSSFWHPVLHVTEGKLKRAFHSSRKQIMDIYFTGHIGPAAINHHYITHIHILIVIISFLSRLNALGNRKKDFGPYVFLSAAQNPVNCHFERNNLYSSIMLFHMRISGMYEPKAGAGWIDKKENPCHVGLAVERWGP
ncbi:hypothetical protein ACJX0J_039001 [Zea mays]